MLRKITAAVLSGTLAFGLAFGGAPALFSSGDNASAGVEKAYAATKMKNTKKNAIKAAKKMKKTLKSTTKLNKKTGALTTKEKGINSSGRYMKAGRWNVDLYKDTAVTVYYKNGKSWKKYGKTQRFGNGAGKTGFDGSGVQVPRKKQVKVQVKHVYSYEVSGILPIVAGDGNFVTYDDVVACRAKKTTNITFNAKKIPTAADGQTWIRCNLDDRMHA